MNFENCAVKAGIWLITLFLITAIYGLIGKWTYKSSLLNSFMLRIDQLIPFMPWMIWIYTSVYFLVIPLVVTARVSIVEFQRMSMAILIMFCVFSVMYAILPSAYPRPNIKPGGGWTRRLIYYLYKYDLPNNTLPSTHAGTATIFLHVFYNEISLWLYVPYAIWAILVIVSTLTVKQHHVLDVITGVFFGWLIYRSLCLVD